MMLGSTNCQSASAASARVRRSSSFNSKTVASSNRWPLKWRILCVPEHAAAGHRAEQGFERIGELVRVVEARSWRCREKSFLGSSPVSSAKKQKISRLRKRAMRRFLRWATLTSARVRASASSALSRLCSERATSAKFLRQRLGDLVGRALRLEVIGILEGGAQQPQVLRAVNLVVGELVGFLDRAVEVGADDVAVEIADDQQGRIEQDFAVAQQLLVGIVEVLLLALVFPAKAVLLPHVGKAASGSSADRRASRSSLNANSSASLTTRFWKQKRSEPRRVGFRRGGLVEQPAEVVEMLLVGGGFLARDSGPTSF